MAFMKEQASKKLYITVAERLQDTIDALTLSPNMRTLDILVMRIVPSIVFHVPSHFLKLNVVQTDKDCWDRQGKNTFSIDGSSTYNNVRINDWDKHSTRNKEKQDHTIVLSPNVRIQTQDFSDEKAAEPGPLPNTPPSAAPDGTSTNAAGTDSGQGADWIEKVKDAIAAIWGMTAREVRLRFLGRKGDACSACGSRYATYALELYALDIGFLVFKIGCCCIGLGPAILAAVTAATAVYFIPWDRVFDWLRGAWVRTKAKACALWKRVWGNSKEKKVKLPQPITFDG